MSLIGFLKNVFRDGNTKVNMSTCVIDGLDSLSYEKLAIESSINLIAKTISRAEFQTFQYNEDKKKSEEIKGINYYILNVEANQNQSATVFWKDTVKKLLTNGEVLILLQNNKLYLADSFDRKEFAIKENIYKDIVISEHKLNGVKKESEVIYLKDDITDIESALNGVCEEYKNLVSASIKGYANSKSRKGLLNIESSYAQTLKNGEDLKEHISNLMKDFMDPNKDAVLPQQKGIDYEEIDKAKGSKSNDSGRETKNFVNDVFDFVGIAYGIPPSLLKGDTVETKDAVSNFLTFCINPLSGLIQDEINRKMYGMENYLQKTYTKLDTSRIKAVNIRDIANSLELLTRTGSNTIDDNLKILGRKPLEDDIGSMRFVTKNLDWVENVLNNELVEDIEGGVINDRPDNEKDS